MDVISLIVHTWGGVDKSHAVCPQRELAFPPCFGGWWTPCVWCWCFADTILATTFKLYRNKYFIFIQLCGLSPIYVVAQEPGRNKVSGSKGVELIHPTSQQGTIIFLIHCLLNYEVIQCPSASKRSSIHWFKQSMLKMGAILKKKPTLYVTSKCVVVPC